MMMMMMMMMTDDNSSLLQNFCPTYTRVLVRNLGCYTTLWWVDVSCRAGLQRDTLRALYLLSILVCPSND